MPLFGYGERDLVEKYRQGVSDGRSQCIRELLTGLNNSFPDLADHVGKGLYLGTSDIIRYLADEWKRKQAQCSKQQSRIASLKRKCDWLKADLEELESGRLHAAIKTLTAERGRARQQIAALQNELDQLGLACAAEKRDLRREIERLDQLIVAYEQKQNVR
jgi:Arc/MetJ-type ribon-helix-helix transcriptional regulator